MAELSTTSVLGQPLLENHSVPSLFIYDDAICETPRVNPGACCVVGCYYVSQREVAVCVVVVPVSSAIRYQFYLLINRAKVRLLVCPT